MLSVHMTLLGMPTGMFIIFAVTLFAGSLGAIHYVVVHVLLGKPFDQVPTRTINKKSNLESGGER